MKTYIVYAPPPSGRTRDDAERLAFIKDGFSWPALFIPLLWLLWQRMWLAALGWLAVAATFSFAGLVPLEEDLVALAAALFGVWFAFEANGLRRWSLERKGWRQLGIASGRTLGEAEAGFLGRWLQPPRPGRPLPTVPPVAPRRPEDPGIGLFPQPE